MGKTNPDLTANAYGRSFNNLYAMAEELMTRVTDAAARLAVSLPSRKVIYMSPVPVDCAQVTVCIIGWIPTHHSDGYINCQTFKWAGHFSVIITRVTCAVPGRDGQAPKAELMKQAAEQASDDADVMVALVQGLEEIGPEISLITGAPEGGFQSVELSITVPAFGGMG